MANRLGSRKAQNLSSGLIALVGIVAKKIVDALDVPMLNRLWTSVFVDIWFIWVAVLVAGLWWLGWELLKLLRDYRALSKWVGADAILQWWSETQMEHKVGALVRRINDEETQK